MYTMQFDKMFTVFVLCTWCCMLFDTNYAVPNWQITVAGNIQGLGDKKRVRDCPYLAQFCENSVCKNMKPEMPTEHIFNSKGALKVEMTDITDAKSFVYMKHSFVFELIHV